MKVVLRRCVCVVETKGVLLQMAGVELDEGYNAGAK